MEGTGILKGIGIFFGILAVVFLVIFFFWFFIIGLAFVLCIVLIIIVFVFIGISILFFFTIPYYVVTKKPEIQYYESYDLGEVKDKDDFKKDKK